MQRYPVLNILPLQRTILNDSKTRMKQKYKQFMTPYRKIMCIIFHYTCLMKYKNLKASTNRRQYTSVSHQSPLFISHSSTANNVHKMCKINQYYICLNSEVYIDTRNFTRKKCSLILHSLSSCSTNNESSQLE